MALIAELPAPQFREIEAKLMEKYPRLDEVMQGLTDVLCHDPNQGICIEWH